MAEAPEITLVSEPDPERALTPTGACDLFNQEAEKIWRDGYGTSSVKKMSGLTERTFGHGCGQHVAEVVDYQRHLLITAAIGRATWAKVEVPWWTCDTVRECRTIIWVINQIAEKIQNGEYSEGEASDATGERA